LGKQEEKGSKCCDEQNEYCGENKNYKECCGNETIHHPGMVVACENAADFGKNLFLSGAFCFGSCGLKHVAAKPSDDGTKVRVTAKKIAVGCPGT
jgi:hypothetical protein